ncbi:hypothetical protein B0T26DRAFT_745921 [Lasiosphaeria miniovina]|uniref:Rho-GAP domain-containing protein n=1 Tax=Lasiosphaeria miniovina TaxID=1954250 RepID=A0AA40BGR8_9PEZI|nr:uncharacterized protein B0T26DRAFT_745921 [Lasiosphaeria miniovina]KAK0733947.1 hypothetical protein B0T26DRAFT_745921 [Lasiosphaeria miniovina]
MGRKPVPQPLALGDSMRHGEEPRVSETVSKSARLDTASPRSPRSPFRFGQKKSESASRTQVLQVADVLQQPPPPQQQQPQIQIQQQQQQQQQQDNHPRDRSSHYPPPLTSPLQQPQFSPQGHSPAYPYNSDSRRIYGQDDDRASTKSGFLFNFGKQPTKSLDRVNTQQSLDSRSETMSRDSGQPALSKQSTKLSDSSSQDHLAHKPFQTLPSKSDLSLASSADYDGVGHPKKNKPKPFTLLSRNRSIKDKDRESRDSPSPNDPAPAPTRHAEPENAHPPAPLRTAPVHSHDRSFREMMSSAVRNHSAERTGPRDISVGRGREQESYNRMQSSSYKENTGSAFFSGLKNSMAAGLSKGFFGGGQRNDPQLFRDPGTDEDRDYVLKVINLPLVQQTRLTRISKRLEESRDKTEFWMPAFPWRAIDYLNYKGSEVEGLYRIPGSGPQIKKWQRKFDEELDVDLFNQPSLYDINIIGSMLKAWLRELPDELFPKEAQDRIARECAGAETVPQMLIDELSNLSPFNYYLLFAITCHLSLLLAHSDKNKMDFRNLCICFQPCMKIDAFCFKFLVCDWRDCWKGCKNEAKFIEEEYARFDQPPPRTVDEAHRTNSNGNSSTPREKETHEERNVSSSDSSKSSNRGANEQKGRLRKKPVPETESTETSSTMSTNLTINSDRETTPPRRSGEMRPLSPIKPLSPLGF